MRKGLLVYTLFVLLLFLLAHYSTATAEAISRIKNYNYVFILALLLLPYQVICPDRALPPDLAEKWKNAMQLFFNLLCIEVFVSIYYLVRPTIAGAIIGLGTLIALEVMLVYIVSIKRKARAYSQHEYDERWKTMPCLFMACRSDEKDQNQNWTGEHVEDEE